MAVVQTINQRPGCMGRLTTKRSLENYLHPIAIAEASGIYLQFDDEDDVASLLASRFLKDGMAWARLSFRSQKRLRDKAKRLLNYRAIEAMTLELLHLQDRDGEVLSWFEAIGRLVEP